MIVCGSSQFVMPRTKKRVTLHKSQTRGLSLALVGV